MLDHISFAVENYEQSVKFYDVTLATLGYEREITLDVAGYQAVGYGNGGHRPCLWIAARGDKDDFIGRARGLHIAFSAPNKEAVDEWYKLCLELGATDNGAPGPRKHYHPEYYGAFIIDPNGWRLEACIHNHPFTHI
jgi:catechol 2,3-dioxygenase-like lactoylglutathione lyase family enzyme